MICTALGGYRSGAPLAQPAHHAYIERSGYLYTDLGPTAMPGRFPQISPGDVFYINPTDPSVVTKFRALPVTVRRVILPTDPDGGAQTRVEFVESDELRSRFTPTSGLGTQVEVNYRAGWLPSAIRVTLRIKDARTTEIRTIQRIFKLLRD
jgi:hypothetical protein